MVQSGGRQNFFFIFVNPIPERRKKSSAFGLASLGTIEQIETKYRLNVTKIEIKIKMNSVI